MKFLNWFFVLIMNLSQSLSMAFDFPYSSCSSYILSSFFFIFVLILPLLPLYHLPCLLLLNPFVFFLLLIFLLFLFPSFLSSFLSPLNSSAYSLHFLFQQFFISFLHSLLLQSLLLTLLPTVFIVQFPFCILQLHLFILRILFVFVFLFFFLVNPWLVTALSQLVSSSPLCPFCLDGEDHFYNLQCVLGYDIL
jgi:hypothetical protein